MRDSSSTWRVQAQLLPAQSAIESHHGGLCVTDRVPECLRGLARQRPARSVRDRPGNDDRQIRTELIQRLAHRVERRLRIQDVEYGLDQDDIDTARDQRTHCLRIASGELIEIDVAKRRVVDVG